MGKISKERIEDYIFKNERYEDDAIVCPYCGHAHKEPEDLYTERDREIFECISCGRKFSITSEINWNYTSTPLEEEVKEILKERDWFKSKIK